MYNGWTNWETWNANLHITNTELTYHTAKGLNAEALKDFWITYFDGTDEIDTSKINFKELSEGINA